jgi:hypothetical protein
MKFTIEATDDSGAQYRIEDIHAPDPAEALWIAYGRARREAEERELSMQRFFGQVTKR